MAKPPQPFEEIRERFGPHLNYTPAGGWSEESRHAPDRLVKTHCCFCGQQCGIQLKVRENRVIGFEPWEEFPFNRGMLCPKGVKRYLQSNHPDRLLEPLLRTDGGFVKTTWNEALDFTARRLSEVQQRYGKDAVAVFGGASLTTEKAYLMGKFARVALGTRHIDYNGRLCMVSAGVAYKLAFDVDRSPIPWSEIPKAQVLFVAGANIGECAPITTDYIWRCRDNGGKLIVADPRMTPISRNADLFLPVRPGTDLALLNSMLHVAIRDNLLDAQFIAEHTSGFDAVKESVQAFDPRMASEITGVPAEAIEKAAHWFSKADRAIAMHARGPGASFERRRELLGADQSDARHRTHGARRLRLHHDHGPGERTGRPRARAEVRSVAGPALAARSGGPRACREGVGHCARRAAAAGLFGAGDHERDSRGRNQGAVFHVLQPGGLAAAIVVHGGGVEKLEFFAVTDFFLCETARYADVVLAGSLQEEEEGVTCSAEGRVIHIQRATDPPGNARRDSEIVCDVARRLGKGKYFTFQSSREIFDELREASRGGHADYYGITYEKIDLQMGVFWPCPTPEHPGTPMLMEGGRSFYPDGKCRFQPAQWRESGDPVDEEFPIYLTTGRVVSQYLSGAQTRRIGALVDMYPEPLVEIHPQLAAKRGIAAGDWVTVTTRRSHITLQASVVRTIRPDTVFIPYHWPDARGANRLTHRTLDPRSKIPEFKVSACSIEKAESAAERAV